MVRLEYYFARFEVALTPDLFDEQQQSFPLSYERGENVV